MNILDEKPQIQPAADLELAHAGQFDDAAERLRGGKCSSCAAKSFPRKFICSVCGSDSIEPTLLSGFGTLYSYTTIHVAAAFPTPYTVGYVDLECGIRVLGHLLIPPHSLGCDLPVTVQTSNQSGTGWGFVITEQESSKNE
jgi:hypothetical protein